MHARVNQDVWDGPNDHSPRRIVMYKGAEGEITKITDGEYPFLFRGHIYLNRDEFDFIGALDDLVELVEEAGK